MSCHWCGGQLKPPKRKFCCEQHRYLYSDSACNPWHRWVFGGVPRQGSRIVTAALYGRVRKVRKLPGPVNGGY